MSALPTGTVTFLFTDIERSSNLWERSPDAMREALVEHDVILRDATARHGGSVFKTIGDAFCCAFAHAEEAIEAAVEAQRGFVEHRWPHELGELCVRMGIHSGKSVERNGDYFGPTVNRVSRLTEIGSGGQILASSASAALVRADAPPGLELRDLGTHRLRDLSQPEAVFQVVAEGIRSDFPALASLDVRPNNLPSQFSSFIGRERETGELQTLLGEHRLVTVAGTGGIGKTRLALHLAAGAIHRFKDGAWFVELASVGDPGLVAQTIASELGVREERSEGIAETLLHYLGHRQLLLLIDNAEHLLGGVAAIVKAILSRCAGVSVLVTSREPLHLTGEQVFRLSSLPEAPAPSGAADLTRHDSTRLFVERARANAPGLSITDGDASEIAGVCRKLEGIPLAIELAAARVATLSVRQLNERLSERLPLLASRDSTQERHRTLRGTIDWSYRLLGDEEKRAFCKLSVCSGGFTLEACERIARSPASSAVDLLESLVEKSFVQVDPNAEVPRFRCLDVMREYASGELAASGSSSQAGGDHARYYAEFAARGRGISGGAATGWHRRLDDETHNLRAALDWCDGNDPALGVRLALDLAPYWRVRSTITEARARLRALLSASEAAAADRAALLCCAASFATMQDDFEESLRLSNEGLSLYRAAGDSSGTGEALFRIAEVEHRRGELDEANRLYEEARGLFVAAGNARGEMLCLANLGMLARQLGDYRNAKLLLADALARAAASGERRIAGEFAIAMGWVDLYLGDFEQSKRRFEESFAQKEAEGDRYGACGARHGLATVALRVGRLGEAADQFTAAIESAVELRLTNYVFRGFYGLGAVAALAGDAESAARYLGLAERVFRESGRVLRDSIAYDVASEAIASIPAARRAELLAEGAGMRAESAVSELRVTSARYKSSRST